MKAVAAEHWEMIKRRFAAWWDNSCVERPMLRVVARRDTPLGKLEDIPPPRDAADIYLNVDRQLAIMRNNLKRYRYMAEAYPNMSLDLGAGSMALYLGSEPVFAHDTVWFEKCLDDVQAFDGAYNPHNPWLMRHIAMFEQARAASDGSFLLNIPDIVENIDILSAMLGPQDTCYAMMDDPDAVERAVGMIDEIYFSYYDRFRELVVTEDNINSFTAFNVLGEGKTAKVQCDFCALMSPAQFRRFVVPSLTRQCAALDHSVYHLDGPDAIKHLDALMEIKELQALQWTCGAGQPDSGSPRWYPIYDRAREAGKALHLSISEGAYNEWVRACDTLVNRYGADGLYFLLPVMSEAEAERFIAYADAHWQKASC